MSCNARKIFADLGSAINLLSDSKHGAIHGAIHGATCGIVSKQVSLLPGAIPHLGFLFSCNNRRANSTAPRLQANRSQGPPGRSQRDISSARQSLCPFRQALLRLALPCQRDLHGAWCDASFVTALARQGFFELRCCVTLQVLTCIKVYLRFAARDGVFVPSARLCQGAAWAGKLLYLRNCIYNCVVTL